MKRMSQLIISHQVIISSVCKFKFLLVLFLDRRSIPNEDDMPITNDNNDIPPGILHVYVYLSYTIKFCYIFRPINSQ